MAGELVGGEAPKGAAQGGVAPEDEAGEAADPAAGGAAGPPPVGESPPGPSNGDGDAPPKESRKERRRRRKESRKERKQRRKEERARNVPLFTALVGLSTALVGFLGGLIGFWRPTNEDRKEAVEEAATLDQQVQDLTVEVDTLQEVRVDLADEVDQQDATITSLQEQVEELQDQVARGGDDGRRPVDPQDEDPVGVFRETGDEPVTFNRGYGIDLGTQADNWGVDDTDIGKDLFLGTSSGELRLGVHSGTVAMMEGPATYQDCDRATVLQGSLTPEQTEVGNQFCAETRDDRWAFITIVGLDRERESITLDIVVWSLETSS